MTTPVFMSVWDALEKDPLRAANMRLRSELMIALRSQVEAAFLRLADSFRNR